MKYTFVLAFNFPFVKRTCGWYKHGVNLICSTYISTSKLAHFDSLKFKSDIASDREIIIYMKY